MVATLHLPPLYQLDEHMQAQMSLHASMEDNFSSEKTELKWPLVEDVLSLMSMEDNFQSEKTELKWLLVEDVLSLMRIRDFISLVLAYPVRIADGGILRKWINDVFEFNAMHSKEMESFLLEMQFLNFWGVQRKPDTFRRIKLLLSEKPLRYIEGLIPEDMISQIKHGWRSISNDNDAIIPEAIFNLGADLAARQLIEMLFSGEDHVLAQNIHHVRLSTRNSIEKGAVVGKIVAALKDEDSVVRLKETFMGVLQIDVSKYPGDEAEIRVQQKLAQELELMITTREQTEDEGVMLRRCIEAEMMWKKYLVLLVDGDGDTMLDPRKMGFPKSKLAGVVVLITNKSSVLHQVDLLMAMDLEIRTKDHLLSWELFCKNVGSELVHSSSVIQNIAVCIVKECCGHLLAVVLVAKWLKNVEDVKLWELALEKLRYTNSSFDINNMEAMSRVMVNAFINFAWEGMSKTIKYCLMRCLFVPEIKVGVIGDHLISDWIRIELVRSREEAEHILRELVDLCLLLPLKDSIVHIRLPEESYDILELLNRANPIVITQGSLGLTRPSNVGQWHEAVQIELMKNRLSELPPSPNCCDLRVLLLHGNPNLTEIPPLFFDQMPLLRILDLSNTSLRDLPSSFFKLMGLKEFCLRGCELFVELPLEIEQLKNLEKLDLSGTPIIHLPPSPNFPKLRVLSLQGNDSLMEIPPLFFEYMPMLHILDLSYTSISDLPTSFFNLTSLRECHLRSCLLLWQLPPEIGQLKNLEKLNLEGTEIIHLPEKIQLLTNLQCLILTFCGNYNNVGHGEKNMRYSSSTIITPGLISNFSKLIHLSIDVNPDDERWYENAPFIIAEIFRLNLKTISLYIPDIRLLNLIPRRISFDFRLVVGCYMQRIISRAPPLAETKFNQSFRSLKFVNGVDVPNVINGVLQYAESFFLDRHMTIKDLSEFEMGNLHWLRLCILAECNEMQTVVDGKNSYQHLLYNLEYLTAFYMKNLRSIWEGSPLNIFSKLKFLALHTCPKLTTIFTLDHPTCLSMLEELIVEDCPKVTTIVSNEFLEEDTRFFLPRLRKLSLLYLPELVSISSGLYIGPRLENIGFYYCPKLQKLSIMELSSKNLNVIKGEKKWWEALQWSEIDWGQASAVDNLSHIFSPINEEADIMTQLVTDDV